MKDYLLRIAIAFDGVGQAMLRYGTHGVTISARTGTAAAHSHPWGVWFSSVLDFILGKDHCKTAIRNDRLRAHAVLKELSDPVVVAYLRRKS